MENRIPVLARKLEHSRKNLQLLIRMQSKPDLTADQRRQLAAFVISANAIVTLRMRALTAVAVQNGTH